MKKLLLATLLATTALTANAAEYKIDTEGAHAFINFKISHLGYSWLHGRFNQFEGNFNYDPENPTKSKIHVIIDTASIDSNHEARDNHLRNSDFLNVEKFPTAEYKGVYFEPLEGNKGILHGDLTLNGVKKHLPISVNKIGQGTDPWGGERVGFEGEVSFKLKDFGINYNLGPASETVYLSLHIEGIKVK